MEVGPTNDGRMVSKSPIEVSIELECGEMKKKMRGVSKSIKI
jgi:hypothetical protein